MGTYDSEVDSCYDSIEEAGGVITIQQPNAPGTYNPATGGFTGGSSGNSFSSYALKQNYEEKFIDGSIIKRGDCEFMVPSKGFTFDPEQGDVLTMNEVEWDILHVNPFDPSGEQVIFWNMQGRKK